MYKRVKKRWEDQSLTGIGRREARTSFYGDSQKKQSLNGEWSFCYLDAPELSPEGFMKPGANQGWNTIDVPSVWQLRGYGRMHYTDVLYLFPVNPPFVPSQNPTGIYKRQFTLDECWTANDTVLKFHGVDSAYDVWVNGTHAGYSKVSRLPSEFDITSLVHAGENDITVRVYKWSDGTYLEDQDMWWMSGIYRDVELLNEPKNAIISCEVKANLDTLYRDGLLSVKIFTKADARGKWSLTEGGKTVAEGVFTTENMTAQVEETIPSVKHWTAETPNLYELNVTMEGHEVAVRAGFCSIEMKDDNFTVNGKVILLNGVNHHDYNPKEGRCMTYEQAKADILLMKQYNINALRCSHYPSNDYLYDLCDEYGLYVIDEADLECHGFEWTGNYKWVTDDPQWKAAYVDRGVRMVKRDRNHPCILMWSLGNESEFGCNFVSMAEAIRELDDTRLIHYEGDMEVETADVYSTMYTRLKPLQELAEGTAKKNKPHVMCEYGHAMGNGPGGLSEYQNLYRSYKRLQGGFIWEWFDHGIETVAEDGSTYYKYGGNYGDFPTNSNFCIDGLLMPDRTPSPALIEYKQVIAPVEITKAEGGAREICLKNYYDFLEFSNLKLCWWISCDDRRVQEGEIDTLFALPGDTQRLEIPYEAFEPEINTDYYLNLSVCLKKDMPYAETGHEVSRAQFLMEEKQVRKEHHTPDETLKVDEDKVFLTVSNKNVEAVFHKVYGTLVSLAVNGKNVITEGPKVTVYRASIDNDMYKKDDWMNKYYIQLGSEQAEYFDVNEKEHKVEVILGTRFGCLNQPWGFVCEYRYTIHEDGEVAVSLTGKEFQKGKTEPEFLPRIGIQMRAAKSLQQVCWYGRGFGENYDDTKTACHMGVYCSTVDGMRTNYVYPQENGHREEVKWLSLCDGAEGLLIRTPQGMGINVMNCTDESLEEAAHPQEIREAEDVIVHLDYRHSGVGSNSCGEEQLPAYKVKRQDFSMAFTLCPVEGGQEVVTSKKVYLD